LNRREFMQCAAILVSGASASQLGFALSQEQQVFLAAQPNFNTREVDYLSVEQRKIVAAMAEAIIPRTDTPGAIDAGVPAFLELMMAGWLNDEEKAIFTAGLEDLENRVPREFGQAFYELDDKQQVKILEALEEDASDSSWYDLTSVLEGYSSDAPFICQFKELTVFGFFTSEAGSTQVLRHNPMPMKFDGEYPLLPDDSTWSGGFA
jgi:glucoside 3-dehydrogenase (cytochrome c) hitch-hiker subunit